MINIINSWREMVSSRIADDKLQVYYSMILQEQPLGTWPPCNYEILKQIFQPAYDKAKGKLFKLMK